MKLRSEYLLLEMCVENASRFVWSRAFKHDPDTPVITEKQKASLERAICEEIMNHVSEWFEFEENHA